MELLIDPEYQKLIPALPKADYEELKKSIEKDGLYYAIIINEKNIILDGHHRATACRELKKQFRTEIKTFKTRLEEKKFVIKSNLNRRQLLMHERAALALELQKIYQEESSGLAKFLASPPKKKDSRKKRIRKKVDTETYKKRRERRPVNRAAKQLHLSDEILRQYEDVLKSGNKKIIEEMTTGRIKISKAKQELKKQEKKTVLLNTKPVVQMPKNCDLKLGDFYEVAAHIPDDSIDLIVTDPPYLEDFEIYEKLAAFAARVLKPGGSLVTFIRQYSLPEIVNIFSAKLKYWWMFCEKHSGQSATIHARNVFVKWKPLLWYVKGDKANIIEFVSDYIDSEPDKLMDEWQQSTIEAEHIIKKLSIENQLVLDPMMGSGTTGIAALKLNRKFIGIEINKEIFEEATRKIGILFD